MSNLSYKPDIYYGNNPYIHISFHQKDKERVFAVLEKLDARGFRFWIDDGINPGTETDEIIAEHIENCDFFIAFLSDSYLCSIDTVDELNYSRDVNKNYLLVYLEDVSLPAGIDMRFIRSQSIRAYNMSDSEIYSQILNIDDVKRFFGIYDEKLRPVAEKVFEQLDELYPEHKVFALDAVNSHLAGRISELYVNAGYPSAERLMLDYGFRKISTDEARSLRSSVIYSPGFEPDVIKTRIDYIMQTLSESYPEKIITDTLSKRHKNIYKSLLGLSVWLGYDSLAEMLNAYGFDGTLSVAGRVATDYNAVIELLTNRYKEKVKPTSLAQLISENPDLKSNISTLMNRSWELFGMTVLQYLKYLGIIVPAVKEAKDSVQSINREIIISHIRGLYNNSPIDCGGSYEDIAETLGRIVVKKNKKEQIFVTDCSLSGDTVRIPYGVDYIDKEAFCTQSEMVTLVIPASVKEIRDSAFSDCTSLETVVLAEGIERIGNNAFAGCTALKKIVLPKSVKSVGNEAFAQCTELSDVSFLNPRTNIQSDAFDGCIYELENLQDEGSSPAEYFELKIDKKNNAKIISYSGDEEVVVIPATIGGHPVVSLEKGCFKGNEYIREVYISDYISAMNGDVFRDCRNLEKVHLSEMISDFTSAAFAGCVNLSEINIPDSMADVKRGQFKDSPLTTLYIGKGTKSISPDAFYKGEPDFATGIHLKKKSLENLIIDTGNEFFKAEGTMLLSRDGKTLIAELGDPVRAVIPEGVEEIGVQAYDRLGSFTEIEFPSTLKKIGEKAFAGTSISRVELPASLEVIENQAFSFCRSLTYLDINEGLCVIGQQAFEGCPIEDVYIPASVESIGSDSFLAVSTYQGNIRQRFRVDTANRNIIADGIALYVKNGDSFTLVKAYNSDLRLKPGEISDNPLEYSILEGTTAITAHAFARCNNLSAVEIPDSLVSIGDMAFWDCVRLTQIHIPVSCTDVSPKAFFGISVNRI